MRLFFRLMASCVPPRLCDARKKVQLVVSWAKRLVTNGRRPYKVVIFIKTMALVRLVVLLFDMRQPFYLRQFPFRYLGPQPQVRLPAFRFWLVSTVFTKFAQNAVVRRFCPLSFLVIPLYKAAWLPVAGNAVISPLVLLRRLSLITWLFTRLTPLAVAMRRKGNDAVTHWQVAAVLAAA